MKACRHLGLFFVLIVCFSLVACGGSSSGGGKSNTSTTVTGQLLASYINGVKVCVDATDNCAVTDNQGNFSLSDAVGKLLAVSIGGNLVIGKVSADTTPITITPTSLAGGDNSIATRITNIFHQAGSTTDNQTYDLSALQSTGANTAAFESYLAGTTTSLKIGSVVVCSIPSVTLECTTTGQNVDCNVTWAPPEGFVGIPFDPISFTITGALPAAGPGTRMLQDGSYWKTENSSPVTVTTALPIVNGGLTTVGTPLKHAVRFSYTSTGATTIKATIFEMMGGDCTFKGGGSAVYTTTIPGT